MTTINNSIPTSPTGVPDVASSSTVAPMADPEGMIAEIAMRLEDSSHRSRESQRRTRRLRTDARRGAIEKKRKSAVMRLVGTVVNSAAQVASGAVQIGSAASSTANKTEVAEYQQAHPAQTGQTGPQAGTATPDVEGAGLDAPTPSETRAEPPPVDTSDQILKAGEGRAQLIGAMGSLTQGAFEFSSSSLNSDAEADSLVAEEHAEHADARGDAAESAERFADKALGHAETIARARHEATMAALKG